jgi:hypothetical protein
MISKFLSNFYHNFNTKMSVKTDNKTWIFYHSYCYEKRRQPTTCKSGLKGRRSLQKRETKSGEKLKKLEIWVLQSRGLLVALH